MAYEFLTDMFLTLGWGSGSNDVGADESAIYFDTWRAKQPQDRSEMANFIGYGLALMSGLDKKKSSIELNL